MANVPWHAEVCVCVVCVWCVCGVCVVCVWCVCTCVVCVCARVVCVCVCARVVCVCVFGVCVCVWCVRVCVWYVCDCVMHISPSFVEKVRGCCLYVCCAVPPCSCLHRCEPFARPCAVCLAALTASRRSTRTRAAS
jgi:hypothetical protein